MIVTSGMNYFTTCVFLKLLYTFFLNKTLFALGIVGWGGLKLENDIKDTCGSSLTNTRIKIICTAGSGLGLSIAQAIAILHGGKIEVRNATNERGEACVCFAVEIYGVWKFPLSKQSVHSSPSGF